jgi:hypothetical protein
VSQVTAFLILHELTAIVPLFGLAALFHYSNWLPESFAEGQSVKEEVERFGPYARRKGWISEAEVEEARHQKDESGEVTGEEVGGGAGGGSVRILVEFATAYAVTKALLPVRIIGSVWFTPWFARWSVLPVGRVMGRVLGRRDAPSAAKGGVGKMKNG